MKAIGEPSIYQAAKDPSVEVYRFTWLRTFHHPVAIRVEIKPDGTGILTTKICDGAGGYGPGKLMTNSQVNLSRDAINSIQNKFEKEQFWQLPAEEDRGGKDGAEWIVEAARAGSYHLVVRWTPESGPIHDLGAMFLFDLEKMEIPEQEMY